MSFFNDDNDDDEHYYDAENKFQERVLANAQKLDKHPLAHLATQLSKGVEAMEVFTEQDPHISKSERIAIHSDTQEAKQALSRACIIIPEDTIGEEQ